MLFQWILATIALLVVQNAKQANIHYHHCQLTMKNEEEKKKILAVKNYKNQKKENGKRKLGFFLPPVNSRVSQLELLRVICVHRHLCV